MLKLFLSIFIFVISSSIGSAYYYLDLLVSYTPKVLAIKGSEQAIINDVNSAIEYANTAFNEANSGIHLRLCHIQMVQTDKDDPTSPNFTSPGAMLDWFPSQTYPVEVTFGSDISVFLYYSDNDPSVGGSAKLAYSLPSAYYGRNVVQLSGILKTLAHEVGHNLGLGHEWGNPSGDNAALNYAHGYEIETSVTLPGGQVIVYDVGTIMAYAVNTDIFSDPTRSLPGYPSEPAGIPELDEYGNPNSEPADCARALREYGYKAHDNRESYPWIGTSVMPGGWRYSSWFKYFNVSLYPWIVHENHADLYCYSGTSFFSEEYGDVYTDSSSYPWMYFYDLGLWLEYQAGTSAVFIDENNVTHYYSP